LWRQSTRAFLASVDIVAIVGKTQFEEFKQLTGLKQISSPNKA
jgi:hypothetical protein